MTSGTFTAITDDVLLDDETFGFSFIASGALTAGMLVKPAGPMQVVKTADGADNAIGVAGDTVAKGHSIAVYGKGCIIRSCVASSTSYGDDLFAGHDGAFENTQTYGGVFPSVGIALETQAAGSACKILLK